ncbi:MAG: ABC transporter permease [Psychrobium sp.]|nr:ABC transporter permease [Psychrobium sp.]
MSQFIFQQKQAWAGLKKKPGFVSAIVATMGITLGALLCILTLAYVLIAKPLPYPEQESLYKVESIYNNDKSEMMGRAYTYNGLMNSYQEQTVFSESALLYLSEDVLTNSNTQPTFNVAFVTPEYFDLLGAKIALGRLFEATEATDTNNPVIVITDLTWRTEYQSDPDILGQKMGFSGTSYTIVGVLAQSFIEPALYETGLVNNVFMPWDFNHAGERQRKAWGNINEKQIFLGKNISNMTETQAASTLSTMLNGKWQSEVTSIPFFKGWKVNIEVRSFNKVILGGSKSTVYLLLAGVIGLVLVACANIANLFMSRTAEQQRQLAIRAALGANKKELFKTLFAETNILMMLSLAVALVISSVGFYVMQHYLAEQLPRVSELSVNLFTLSCAAIITLLLATFFARISSRMINYKALNATLQSSGKGTGIQVSKTFRKVLIICQVAIVTTLVFISISLLKDALRSIEQPLGFTTDNLTSLSLSVSAKTMPKREEMIPLMTQLRQELLELPQVVAISHSSSPYSGFSFNAQTSVKTGERFVVNTKRIDQEYFSMISQPFIEGDNFSAADIKDRSDVTIINEVYAKALAPDGDALGQQISFGGDDKHTIIGIIKGTLMPGETDISMQAYRPTSLATTQMTIQLKPGKKLTREQAVTALNGVTSQFTVFKLERQNDHRVEMLFTQYTTAISSAVLAIITFILSAIGLYGILSYSTQMRSFEIGTRLAIGAKGADLIKLIVGENMTSITVGIVVSMMVLLGIYVAFDEVLVAYISYQLLGMFVVTIVLISFIALFACYWPLRRFIKRPAIYSLRDSD